MSQEAAEEVGLREDSGTGTQRQGAPAVAGDISMPTVNPLGPHDAPFSKLEWISASYNPAVSVENSLFLAKSWIDISWSVDQARIKHGNQRFSHHWLILLDVGTNKLPQSGGRQQAG